MMVMFQAWAIVGFGPITEVGSRGGEGGGGGGQVGAGVFGWGKW